MPRPSTPPNYTANGKPVTAARDWRPLYRALGIALNDRSPQAMAEACPFCEGPKFYVNVLDGRYDCKHCGEIGNHLTLIRWYHDRALTETTKDVYARLRKLRGIPPQVLARHELAYDRATRSWLIPSKTADGNVFGLVRWTEPQGDQKGKILNFPGLPVCLFGLDQLSTDPAKLILVCEGPWDAMALDYQLKQNRRRYDLLAVPSCSVFKPDWVRFFRGRNVRLLYDNDEPGRTGQNRAAKTLREANANIRVSVLEWPQGYPNGCDIRDLVSDGTAVIDFSQKHCVTVGAGERRIKFLRGDEVPEETVEWLWSGHIPLGTFASFEGPQGSGKSTVARAVVALATTGKPMPTSSQTLAPCDVLYFTSEDSAARVRDSVKLHGGDLTRLHVYDIAAQADPVDLLDCLEEIEGAINARKVKLVVIDALNSFVCGDVTTDSKARKTLSGRLQSLAKRTGACVIGIRNWGRMDGAGPSSAKALGAVSLSHVARCCMNTRELGQGPEGKRRFQLEFEKVSDAPQPEPIRYSVEDLSHGNDATSHHRRIVWEP